MITSITTSLETWTKFSIKVMELYPGNNKNRVIEKLIEGFNEGKFKVELDNPFKTEVTKNKKERTNAKPKRLKIAAMHKNRWVAIIGNKVVTSTKTKEETERLTIQGYGPDAKAIIRYVE